MTATPARWAALDALRGVRRGELADRALADPLERLPPAERAWTQELVLGTIRLRGRLDHLLAQRVRRGLAALEPDVLDVLRLGAYQLLEMGSVPDYAAVSQSVEQAKALSGAGAAGLVNGVLQRLARERDALVFPRFGESPVEHLATWGSHPRWLVERWLARYGEAGARSLVEANNRRPELYLRLIGVGAAEARSQLAAAGIESEPVEFSPGSLRVLPPAGAAQALGVVAAVVQDPAAALVVRYAAIPPGSRVVDLCAAPGGKAVALAENARLVVAADVSPKRLVKVGENAARLGVPVAVVAAAARRAPRRPGAGGRRGARRAAPAGPAGRRRAAGRAVHRDGHAPPPPRREMAAAARGS